MLGSYRVEKAGPGEFENSGLRRLRDGGWERAPTRQSRLEDFHKPKAGDIPPRVSPRLVSGPRRTVTRVAPRMVLIYWMTAMLSPCRMQIECSKSRSQRPA